MQQTSRLQYKDVLKDLEEKTRKADSLVNEWRARITAHHEVPLAS